jgi:hypothetical protein
MATLFPLLSSIAHTPLSHLTSIFSLSIFHIHQPYLETYTERQSTPPRPPPLATSMHDTLISSGRKERRYASRWWAGLLYRYVPSFMILMLGRIAACASTRTWLSAADGAMTGRDACTIHATTDTASPAHHQVQLIATRSCCTYPSRM